jgi:hypothetical protein
VEKRAKSWWADDVIDNELLKGYNLAMRKSMFSFWEEVDFHTTLIIKNSSPAWVMNFFRKELTFFR